MGRRQVQVDRVEARGGGSDEGGEETTKAPRVLGTKAAAAEAAADSPTSRRGRHVRHGLLRLVVLVVVLGRAI